MKDSVLPFLTILYNINNYYKQLENKKCKKKIEDEWILSRLNSLIKNSSKDLENYYLDKAFQKILDFVVKDFSRSYIKMTRGRNDTKEIVGEVLEKISLLLAPFAPYITEFIYREFGKKSVHLSKWPKVEEKRIDKKLEKDFETALQIIEKGLAERDKIKIGLKWPLAKAVVICDGNLSKDILEIIENQLNVKGIDLKKAEHIEVNFDTKMTPELEAEGYAREMSRHVQAFRKKLGLDKKDKIELFIISDEEFKKILEKNSKFIKNRTNSKKLEIVTTAKERFKNRTDFKIRDKKGEIVVEMTTGK